MTRRAKLIGVGVLAVAFIARNLIAAAVGGALTGAGTWLLRRTFTR